MSEYYLLSYKSVPLGIYNKLCYLLDYILELIRFPDKNINLDYVEINLFSVNIAYPSSTLVFKQNSNNKRIYFEELNGKRVEMSDETFTRFKKIQNHFIKHPINTKKENKTKNIIIKEIEEETVKKVVTIEELKMLEDKKTEILDEQKENIEKMNRLKNRMKVLINWQNQFISDLKLYEKFVENKKDDDSFVIPEMFEEKYNFLKEQEKVNECFTDYFLKFNPDSGLDINEINEMLNDIESDSDNSESICDDED